MVGQRWGKVEPAVWGRRRYSFTHRTKVFADGTIAKIDDKGTEIWPVVRLSDLILRPYMRKRSGSDAPTSSENVIVPWSARSNNSRDRQRRIESGPGKDVREWYRT